MIEGQNPKNNSLFIACMISLVLALSLVSFAVYILPNLIWHVSYDVPEFVSDLREWFRESYSYSESRANWTVFFMFFIPGIIAGIITYIITNILERSDDVDSAKTNRTTPNESEDSTGTAMKVLFLVCLVFVLVFFAEWFFSATL